jgi:hypothetical protein
MASRAGTRSGTALAAAATAAAAAMAGPAASRVGPAVAMAAAARVEMAARGKTHTRGICNAGSCTYATHAHKRKHIVSGEIYARVGKGGDTLVFGIIDAPAEAGFIVEI